MPVRAVVGTLCALLFVAAVSLLLVRMRCTKRQSDGASPEEARSTTGIDHDLDRDFKAMAMSADKEERMYHIPSPRRRRGTSATGERARKYVVVM